MAALLLVTAAMAAGTPAAGPLAVSMLAGFLIGAVGHLYHSRAAILVGIVLIGVTTAIFVLATDPALGA